VSTGDQRQRGLRRRRWLYGMMFVLTVFAAGVAMITAGVVRRCGVCSRRQLSADARKVPTGLLHTARASVDGPWKVLAPRVALSPMLLGGYDGWCVVIDEFACGGIRLLASQPIIIEHWNAQLVGHGPETVHGWAITKANVAAVAVGSGADEQFPTTAVRTLPDHLRAVVVERTLTGHGLVPRIPTLRFTPLGAGGRPLAQHAGSGTPLTYQVPVAGWEAPAPVPQGICSIEPASLSRGVLALGGIVMQRLASYPVLLGRPYIVCASTIYRYGQKELKASVLLDARQPGRAPAALPGMRPVRGWPGAFQAPGAEGKLFARRVGVAWLVVSGGQSPVGGGQPATRLTLLEHLQPTVRL